MTLPATASTKPPPASDAPGLRAVATGMVLGALLTPCNIYSGLKIGWSFNMSIAGALLALAFWRLAEQLTGARHWGLQENVVNQTTASSAASIVSGGLVAPIPALALLGGPVPEGLRLMLWVFSVSVLGIVIALILHRRFIRRDGLPFPAGTASAETLASIHGAGPEARGRVRALGAAAVLGGGVKLLSDAVGGLRWWLPGRLDLAGGSIGFKPLGLALDVSPLMIGFGAIIGLRAGLSLLAGALLAWLLAAPALIHRGVVPLEDPDAVAFGPLVEWLLWPGVALMTAGALASLWVAWRNRHRAAPGHTAVTEAPRHSGLPVPALPFWCGATLAVLLVVATQHGLFGIPLAVACAAVAMALGLAVVAARVVGETGIPPIGALGKISQLGVGALAPTSTTANLMGANVTGGAAGQTADLLNDLKAGALLGARPTHLAVAQVFGILTGSVVGVLSYQLLIPDPRAQLLGPEWPAPAVATWKAVAEVLAGGLGALPEGAAMAAGAAALCGIALALWPQHLGARWLPSPTAMGLAFVIPAWIAFALCLGAVLAAAAHRLRPRWSTRFVLAIAAGLVAGESLTGVGSAAWQLLGSTVG